MIKYLNKYNGMVYWIENDVVMCDDPDLSDPIESAFTVEEFEFIKEEQDCFEEIE